MSAPETALATAPAGPLLKVEEARAILAECRTIDEAKEIADQAAAVKVYLRQQRAALGAQNDAAEIQLRAGVRVGELLQEQAAQGQRQRRGDAGRAKANAPKAQPERLAPPPTLADLGLERNQAQRFQQLARVPEEKRETFIRAQREGGGELTAAGLIKIEKSRNPHAASNVNNGDPAKNIRFTDPDWAAELHQRFGFTVDAFGQADAPLSKLVGRWYTVQEDGFAQDYSEERVVANPEWPQLPEVGHLAHVQAEGGCPLWVLIMPATRTEQPWWHDFVEAYRPDRGGAGVRVEYQRGRKNYGNPDDPACEDAENRGVGMPSCLVIWEGERRRAPGFPELVDCGCGHLHSEGQSCWCCSCKVGADAAEAPLREHAGEPPPNLSRRTLGGGRRALTEDMPVDRFRGEAINLSFSTRVAAKELHLRCLAKNCNIKGGERFAFSLSSDGKVERSAAQLQHLRAHAANHRKPAPKKKPKKRGKGRTRR